MLVLANTDILQDNGWFVKRKKLAKANFLTKKCAMGGIRDIERKRKTKSNEKAASDAFRGSLLIFWDYTVSHASA